MGKHNELNREIRVRRVGGLLHEDVKNISGKVGVTKNKFIKGALKEILSTYPDYMKEGRQTCSPCMQTCIRGISAQLKREFQNIADFAGVDVGDLIKIELARKSIEYPADYKIKMAG